MQSTACRQVLFPAPFLGRPLPNSKIYILDAHRQPVPVGVPGQVYISRKGVARGYWNQPEKTAERFTADWFSKQPEERIYRTGTGPVISRMET